MSRTPSPVTSTTSQNLVESTEDGRRIPTQSLRQASVAIEAAYQRISQVRRSLLELTDNFSPSPSPRPRASNSSFDPGHEAILLGDFPEEENNDPVVRDMERLRSTLPTEVMERIEQYEANYSRSSPHRFASPSQPPFHDESEAMMNTSTPVRLNVSNIPLPAPRRSQLEAQVHMRRAGYHQRVVNPNDSSTALGRRVAAREAGRLSNSTDPATPEYEGLVINRATADIARNIENLHSRVVESLRRSEPSPRADSILVSDADLHNSRSLDSGRSARESLGGSDTYFPSRQATNNRRWRAMRVETRQSSGPSSTSQSERLSILSNFSVQNLSTPTSALGRDRPLIFEEPQSYVQVNDGGGRRTEDREGSDGRSYLIRRRMTPDGEEHVHNINLELEDEDPVSWLLPTRDRLQDVESVQLRRSARLPRYERVVAQRAPSRQEPRTSGNVSVEPPLRRRGWARLDADGNEIPTDEEEELERNRAQYRVRAHYHARAAADAMAAAQESLSDADVHEGLLMMARARTDSLMPVTRTSMAYRSEDENIPVRVRLNPREGRTHYSSAMYSGVSPGYRRPTNQWELPEVFGSGTPFMADPLPTPLEEMNVSQRRVKQRVRGVRVPRHASLAGR